MPPPRHETATALLRLPSAWHAALAKHPDLLEQAALLRDEIHAVTNRVERILAAPGSRLSAVEIHAPTALAAGAASASASTPVVVSLIRMAVDRMALVAGSLRTDDWDLEGRVGAGTVTVAQLIHVPLHHSHRDLTGVGAVGEAVVIPFDPHRRLGQGRAAPEGLVS